MQLVNGKRYGARIELGMFEKFATNEIVQSKLEEAGFVSVVVEGAGKERVAKGSWSRSSRDADLPSQVKEVWEIPADSTDGPK